MKLIFLNGPPACGKSTATTLIRKNIKKHYIVFQKAFAKNIKDGTHASLGLCIPWNYYEGGIKDKPNKAFFGLTPRAAYIAHSEKYMKPIYGKDIFARLLFRDINDILITYGKLKKAIVVISDCGFIEEYEYFVKKTNINNVLLLRIHRKNCTFENDSRIHIKTTLPSVFDIENNNTIPAFQDALLNRVVPWLAL